MKGYLCQQSSVRTGPLVYFTGFADQEQKQPQWTTDRSQAPVFEPKEVITINGLIEDCNLWHLLVPDEIPAPKP